MKKIALITDSSCDLKLETMKEYNIEMLPLRIIYKDKEFLDKITLTPKEMYANLEEEVPTTSLPDLKYTEDVIEKIKSEGFTDVIVMTVSSKLSGTYNSVRLVCEAHNELNFHFFDTKTLGYPQGAIVLETARMIKEDKSLEEILDKLEDIRKRTHGYITFKTLEYLKRGGRIGKVAGTIGDMLHLKPIVSSNDEGVLYNYAKARGRKKAISKMKDILNEYLNKCKCKVWVLSGDCDDEAKEFFDLVKNHPNISEISLQEIGAAMGIHTGPGALGLAILEEV
ncbi:DegV family protein [Eubacterium multiforme]|uniref:DegV family protein with EDD domain n=1 Tax=Eubacterium multiforme TaxID=83339 RepID=A0ABT9UNQ9_9FIRM|nr:DegV family protein [Eubacterium multiforme]MDQ0148278.1 DegV family protein with EDD domain [Eubacterium multiforme]